MADLLGEAVLEIRADLSRVRSDLNQLGTTTEATLKGIEDQAVSSAGRSSAAFQALGSAVAVAFVAAGGFAAVSGAVDALQSFATEADAARISAQVFTRTLADNGADTARAGELVTQLASRFKVLPSAVQDSIGVFVRAGVGLDQVEKALITVGSSAKIAGANLEESFQRGALAFTQGRSELLDTLGVAVNASDAYKELAKSQNRTTESLTTLEKANAFINAAFRESTSEINAVKDGFGGLQEATQDLNNAQALLRQEIGGKVAPAFTSLTTFSANLTTEFTKLISSSTAAQVGLGAFAGLAVTAGLVAGFAAVSAALVALPALAATATAALSAVSAAFPLLAVVTAAAAVVTYGLTINAETAKINSDVDSQINKWEELAKQIGKTGAIARLVNAKQEQGSVLSQIAAVQAQIIEANRQLDAAGPVGSAGRGAVAEVFGQQIASANAELTKLQTQLGGLKRTIAENQTAVNGFNAAQAATVAVSRDLSAEARVLVLALNEARKGFSSSAILEAEKALAAFTKGNKDAAAAVSAVTTVINNQLAVEQKANAEREKERIKAEAAEKKRLAALEAIANIDQREAFAKKIAAAVDNQNVAQLKLLATQLQQDERTARAKNDVQGLTEAMAKQGIVADALTNINEQFNEAARRTADVLAVARGQTSAYTATVAAVPPTVKALIDALNVLSNDALNDKLLEAINSGDKALEQAARTLIKFRAETAAAAAAITALAEAEAKAADADAFATQVESAQSVRDDVTAILDDTNSYYETLEDVQRLLDANNALLKGDRDLTKDQRDLLELQNGLLRERFDILTQLKALQGDSGPIGSAPTRIDAPGGSEGGSDRIEAQSDAVNQLAADTVKLYQEYARGDITAEVFLDGLDKLNTRAEELDTNVISLAGAFGEDLAEKIDNATTDVYGLTEATEQLAGVVYNADGTIDVAATRILKLAIAAGEAKPYIEDLGDQVTSLSTALEAAATNSNLALRGVNELSDAYQVGLVSADDFADVIRNAISFLETQREELIANGQSALTVSTQIARLQATLDKLAQSAKGSTSALVNAALAALALNKIGGSANLFDKITASREKFDETTEATKKSLAALEKYGNLAIKVAGQISGLLSGTTDLQKGLTDLATTTIDAVLPGIGSLLGGINDGLKGLITSIFGESSAERFARETRERVLREAEQLRKGLQTISERKASNAERGNALKFVDRNGLSSKADAFGFVEQLRLKFAEVLESGVSSGLSNGVKSFFDGTGGVLDGLKNGIRDAVIGGFLETVVQKGIIQGALGGLLGSLSAAFASGDTEGAAAIIKQIGAALPGLTKNLEELLQPLVTVVNDTFGNPNAPTTDAVKTPTVSSLVGSVQLPPAVQVAAYAPLVTALEGIARAAAGVNLIDGATTRFDVSVSRFDSSTLRDQQTSIRFDAAVTRLEQAFTRPSSLPAALGGLR